MAESEELTSSAKKIIDATSSKADFNSASKLVKLSIMKYAEMNEKIGNASLKLIIATSNVGNLNHVSVVVSKSIKEYTEVQNKMIKAAEKLTIISNSEVNVNAACNAWQKAIKNCNNLTEKMADGAEKISKTANNKMNSDSAGGNLTPAADKGSGFSKVFEAISNNISLDSELKGIGNSVMAYNEVAFAQERLSLIMKQKTKATNEQIESIIKLTQTQQRMGVVDDQILNAGVQQLAMSGTKASLIQKLIPAMGDILAAQHGVNVTNEDAVNVGNIMSNVLKGQVDDLQQLGIHYNASQEKVLKYGSEQQRMAMLSQLVQKNVGGMNKAIADTNLGRISQAKNAFNDLKIKIGETIAPIVDLAARFVVNNWEKLAPWIERVTVALIALKIAISIASVVQMIFNGALGACPIIWIIAGITALVVAGYYLIKNWDKVKLFLNNLWNGIKTTFSNALKFIWKLFDNKYVQAALLIFAPFIGLPVLIIKNWSAIKTFFAGLWNGIKKVFSGVSQWFGSIFDGVVSIFKGYINIWIGLINFIIGTINKIHVNVPKGVPLLGGKTFGFTIPLVPMLEKGINNFSGGSAIVGENGPELVNLPRGSQVFSHSRTQSLLNVIGNSGAGITVNYSPQIIIQGNADAKVMKTASDNSYIDFERKFNALMDRRRRLSFAGG